MRRLGGRLGCYLAGVGFEIVEGPTDLSSELTRSTNRALAIYTKRGEIVLRVMYRRFIDCTGNGFLQRRNFTK
jgi:hypothetical protein